MNHKIIQNHLKAIKKLKVINLTLRMTVYSYHMMMSRATIINITIDSNHIKIIISANIRSTRFWHKSAICRITRCRGSYNENCYFKICNKCQMKWMMIKDPSLKKAASTSIGAAIRTTRINTTNKTKCRCSRWGCISTLNLAPTWKSSTTTKTWPRCTDSPTKTCTRRMAGVPEGSIIPIVVRLTNKTSPSAA